jgi:hypothetical protein
MANKASTIGYRDAIGRGRVAALQGRSNDGASGMAAGGRVLPAWDHEPASEDDGILQNQGEGTPRKGEPDTWDDIGRIAIMTWMDKRHKDPNPMGNAMAYKGNHTIFSLDLLSFIDNNPVPLVQQNMRIAATDAGVPLQSAQVPVGRITGVAQRGGAEVLG